MRKALAGKGNPIAITAIPQSVPAPVAGLNSRDQLGMMKPTEALILDNFVCRETSVDLRAGQSDLVTGFGATEKVWGLHPYRNGVSDVLFGSTDLGIYNVTTLGAVGAAVTACTSGKWESLNSVNSGIRYLLMANGVDAVKLYDGTTWSAAAITGVDPTTLSNLSQFKFRVFFTQTGSLSFYYLAVNAVQGAASEFPLGPLFRKGGSLLACSSWTLDGGNGADDYAVFITTEGEVAVYKGTDPSNAATWAMVGVYTLPRPIGKKCLCKYGGDLIVITEEGLVELSQVMQAVAIDRTNSISNKNSGNISDAVRLYKGNYGWSLTHLSNESLLILNVPTVEGSTAVQYCMNTVTGAWSSFSSMNALCFVEFGARLFYGTVAKVVYALTGLDDFGNNILATAMTSYNYFGSRVQQKQIKLLKLNLVISKATSIGFAISNDYQINNYITQAASSSNGLSLFDVSYWDQSYWVGGTFTDASWRTVAHQMGACLSTLIQVNDKNLTLKWNATDYLLSKGGVL